jgi:hypothetical protein
MYKVACPEAPLMGMDGVQMGGTHGPFGHGRNLPCFSGCYVLGLTLPRHQNPCQATSKLLMHFRHVAEIMLGQ